MRRCAVLSWFVVFFAFNVSAAVSGRVVSTSGKPLSGLEVVAVRPPTYIALASGTEPEPIARVTTDAGGAFIIDAGNGLIDIRVRAEGFAPADEIVAADQKDFDVVLTPAASVSGRVTAAGKPIAGARVSAANERTTVTATTDTNGRYRMADPKVWAQSVIVRHPDFAPSVHPPGVMDFSLTPGEVLKGRVVSASGDPAGAAIVDVDFLLSATTAPDGSFRFEHAARQHGWIRARAKGAVVMGPLLKGEPVLKLQPAARVRGVVRDDKRNPLAGVRLRLAGESFMDETTTGADGAFVFPVAVRGELMLGADGGRSWQFESIEANTTQGDTVVDVKGKRREAICAVVSNTDGSKVTGASLLVAVRMRNGMTGVVPGDAFTRSDGRGCVFAEFDADYTSTIIAVIPGRPVTSSQPLTASTREVRLTVPEGKPVRGVVKDANGKTLANVRIDPVLSTTAYGREALRPISKAPWATTGDDGSFAGHLAAGATTLAFTRDGFITSQTTLTVPANAAVQVELAPAVVISGRIVDDAGAPVAETPVIAGSAVAMTDANGAFTIEGLEKGPVTLRYGRRMAEKTVSAPVRDLKLVMPRSRIVSGRVVDAITRRPIETFSVQSNLDGDTNSEGVSSADGTFSVELEPGAKLAIKAAGYLPASDVEVGTAPLQIALSRGRTARGHVIDEQKQPIAGVRVTTEDSASLGETNDQQPQSGPDGSYEITGLAADADTNLAFHKEGYVDVRRKVSAGRDDVTADVVLQRGVVVSGRVVRPSGAAGSGFTVSATSAGHGAGYSYAQTDENGAFRFTDLIPTRYDFSVSRTPDGEEASVRDVDVQSVHEITLQLQKRASATVTGKIVGAPPSTMTMVMVSSPEGDTQNAAAEPDGTFKIENAPAGLVEVRAMAMTAAGPRWTRKETVEVMAGVQREVELRYPTQHVLSGVVTRAGTPFEGARISFSGDNSSNALAGSDGRYEVKVDDGEYEVRVFTASTALPYSRKISVTSNQTVDINIDDATVVATVIDAESGLPLRDASVSLSRRGETHTFGSTKTGADGIASVPAFRAEPVNAVAEKPGYANASVEVVATGRTAVTIRLARTVGSPVRLVDARDGRTLSGYVVARERSGRIVASSTETDPDGTTTLPLAAGDYKISASAEGYGSHTITARVPVEGEIRVTLPRGGTIAVRAPNGTRGKARLLLPNGEEYVRCWCNGIAVIEIEGAVTQVDRISPGTYTLEVTPNDHPVRRFAVSVREGQTATVTID